MKATAARVLLTGAGGGIGAATAATLIEAGASVMLVGRSSLKLAGQTETLQPRQGRSRVSFQQADLTRPDDIAGLAKAAGDWGCNVVIHGAGLPSFGRLGTLSSEQMRQVLDTNLLAPMLLTQALLPHLQALPQAQVMLIGSVLGRLGLPGYSVYCASKFGLRGFAEALRRELDGSRVAVQYLGPRSTRTGFNSSAADDYNRATATASDPAELVARAVLDVLESERAERFLGFPEKLAVRINGLAPSWLDGAFAKHRANLP
ncbi:SDR family oxidoreductase [soil metagenome]